MNAYTLPDGHVQISFSGGRTSGYMLHQILEANGGLSDRVKVVFSNTGREMPETLDFVQECGERWGVPIVWVEWRDGVAGERFKAVSHKAAARNGEPFEALIEKRRYLPNQKARFCTADLKVRPARDYLRSIGWERWTAAIGIRADEPHRYEGAADLRERWVRWCPLIAANVGRHDVQAWWSRQPFDLRLPVINGRSALGNCDGCFLKSESYLAALPKHYPDRHAWWEAMEAKALRLTSNPNGAKFSKRFSRAELRRFIETQGDWVFETKGALCQANDGECTT